MATLSTRLEVEAATTHRLRLGPVFDRMIRGALAIGFLGLGVGGFVAPAAGVSFDAASQWSFALGGASLGLLLGLVMGLANRR